MSDSLREEALRDLNENYADVVKTALGMTIEEASDFVSFLENDKLKEYLRKFLLVKEKEAIRMAFPGGEDELLTHKGYLEVAGVIRALRLIKNDFNSAVENHREYEARVSDLYRKEE